MPSDKLYIKIRNRIHNISARWTDGWTNGRKDNMKTVYVPHTMTVCGRIVHNNVILYLSNAFGQTGLKKLSQQCRPRSDAVKCGI